MKPGVILIIDDDNDDREFLKEAIAEYDGHIRFRECKNGVEALAYLNHPAQPVPDIIFLDLNMPLMNGRQCLRQIRKIEGLAGTPVIIYTTLQQPPEPLERLAGPGPVHFLTKPSKLAQLRLYVRNIMERNWHQIDEL